MVQKLSLRPSYWSSSSVLQRWCSATSIAYHPFRGTYSSLFLSPSVAYSRIKGCKEISVFSLTISYINYEFLKEFNMRLIMIDKGFYFLCFNIV